MALHPLLQQRQLPQMLLNFGAYTQFVLNCIDICFYSTIKYSEAESSQCHRA